MVDGSSELDTSQLTGEATPLAAVNGTPLMSGMMNLNGTFRMRATAMVRPSEAKSASQKSVDAELVRVVEDVAVTVRRQVEVEERHRRGSSDRAVRFRPWPCAKADHGRHVAQDLLGRGVDERQVGDELLLLAGKA